LHAPNLVKLSALIAPGDRVLNVGGHADPFPLATDLIAPHPPGPVRTELRDLDGKVLAPVEVQSVRHDLCGRSSWPFEDKAFDFCVCARVLETVRDPVWVCCEMIRVAKRGYIEVTSRVAESSRDQQPGVPVGFAGHRYLVEVDVPKIVFTPKDGLLYGDRRYSFPPSFAASLPEDRRVSWFFWEERFFCEEQPSLTPDGLLAFRRAYLPPDGAEGSFEQALEQAEAENGYLQAQNQELRARLSQYEDVSGMTLRVARKLRNVSRRYPRLTSPVRKVLRAIA
jgi:hypothetical protein